MTLRAIAGRDARGAHAARARADDEQIDLFDHAMLDRSTRTRLRDSWPFFFISARILPMTSSDRLVGPGLRTLAMLSSSTSALRSSSFLPSGDLVEGEHVLELLLGEALRIELGAISFMQLGAARRELGAQLGRDLVQVLAAASDWSAARRSCAARSRRRRSARTCASAPLTSIISLAVATAAAEGCCGAARGCGRSAQRQRRRARRHSERAQTIESDHGDVTPRDL